MGEMLLLLLIVAAVVAAAVVVPAYARACDRYVRACAAPRRAGRVSRAA